MPSLHVSASTGTTRTRLLQGDCKDAGSPALLIPVQLAFGFGGGPVGAAGTAFKPCISGPQLVNSHYITCPASARICSAPWGRSGQVSQHQRPGFHPNVWSQLCLLLPRTSKTCCQCAHSFPCLWRWPRHLSTRQEGRQLTLATSSHGIMKRCQACTSAPPPGPPGPGSCKETARIPAPQHC